MSMTARGVRYSYGPVPSRRLGRSLGINNIPAKICTYSCVYCQVGRTTQMQTDRCPLFKPQDVFLDVRNRLAEARHILFLGDNAGEIVFDRLLIERLSPEKVTVAVRGGPVINDATLEDARAAGLSDLVKVISNGSDAPGTILEDCSPSFREVFEKSDLIIAKGQGNYETLSSVEKGIAFLFQVKCSVIATRTGAAMGTMVIRQNHKRQA